MMYRIHTTDTSNIQRDCETKARKARMPRWTRSPTFVISIVIVFAVALMQMYTEDQQVESWGETSVSVNPPVLPSDIDDTDISSAWSTGTDHHDTTKGEKSSSGLGDGGSDTDSRGDEVETGKRTSRPKDVTESTVDQFEPGKRVSSSIVHKQPMSQGSFSPLWFGTVMWVLVACVCIAASHLAEYVGKMCKTDRELCDTFIVMSIFCMWMMWAMTWLSQLHPVLLPLKHK